MPVEVVDVMGEMTQGVRTAAYGVYVMVGIAAFPIVLMAHNVRQVAGESSNGGSA